MSWRRWIVVGLLLVSGCQTIPAAQPRAPAPAPGVRLLMTIVIDQLAAWEAAERFEALPPEGGFARLRREGLYARELRYEHAATDTAPGHAALYSGAVPRASGIFANEVLGPDGKPQSVLSDEATRLVGADGVPLDRPASSLARLRAETLADALVTTTTLARVYSFSLKDRAAMFGGGRKPTVTLWLDVKSDQLVTSSALPPPPLWASTLGDHAALGRARQGGWTLTDADRTWVAARAETPDDQPGEGDLDGMGRVFPHVVPSTKASRATPVGDRLVLALGRAALSEIAKAGDTSPPTLLALSLSSHDYIAHVFGPHSWEAWAALLELDRGLASLFEAADRAVGAQRYAVMLTGDHGGGALPELPPEERGVRCGPGASPDRWERACAPTRRISPREVVDALEGELDSAFGPADWIVSVVEPLVYLTARGGALPDPDRRRLVEIAKRALAPLGVEDVIDTRAPAAATACPAGTARAALVCNAIDPKGPADLFLVVGPGAFFDPDVVPGFGMSHGSRFLYDRAVPLLVRAPGRVAAGALREAPVSFASFSRTAASLLGIRPPGQARPGDDLAR